MTGPERDKLITWIINSNNAWSPIMVRQGYKMAIEQGLITEEEAKEMGYDA